MIGMPILSRVVIVPLPALDAIALEAADSATRAEVGVARTMVSASTIWVEYDVLVDSTAACTVGGLAVVRTEAAVTITGGGVKMLVWVANGVDDDVNAGPLSVRLADGCSVVSNGGVVVGRSFRVSIVKPRQTYGLGRTASGRQGLQTRR